MPLIPRTFRLDREPSLRWKIRLRLRNRSNKRVTFLLRWISTTKSAGWMLPNFNGQQKSVKRFLKTCDAGWILIHSHSRSNCFVAANALLMKIYGCATRFTLKESIDGLQTTMVAK